MTVTLSEAAEIQRRLKAKGLEDQECQILCGAKVLLEERPDLLTVDDAEFYRQRLRALGELE